jgi:tubulin-specific chaperone A
MADPRIRTIKIKSGVVKRLAKEKVVYEREVEVQKVRIEKLKAQGKDEYELKKQDEVLKECLMMVPDCQRRLSVAYDDLKNILDTEKDLENSADYITAQKILDEAKLQLPKTGELHMC